MSRLLTLQDDSGGFDFVGNAFQVKDKDARKLAYIIRILLLNNCMNYVSGHAEHRRFKKGTDLKQNLLSSCGNIIQKRDDKCKAERPHLQHLL